MKIKTFKVLSLFLMYPSEEWQNLITEAYQVLLTEKVFNKKRLKSLEQLLYYFQKTDLLSLQEQYVEQFDRIPSCSLHLFEHVYGESRERGQAMVDLQDVYKEQGMIAQNSELPDFLPLFLEYLSFLPKEEALDMLGETITIGATLAKRLGNQNSPYQVVFDVLTDLSKVKPDMQAVTIAIAEKSGGKQSTKEIDKLWAEQPAFDALPKDNACGLNN
jgi:nitrate reductase molybdenum cofactor assembly chaperone NarJ/NarW